MTRLAQEPPIDAVVVTGLHRSGTTFLGSLLDAAQGTSMLSREPTNYNWGVRGVPRWYPMLVEADLAGDTESASVVESLLRLTRGRAVSWTHGDSQVRSLGANVVQNAVTLTARVRSRCLVVKDPFLSLSVPFVQRHLTRRTVLVAVRHPAAWALSLERVDWHPGSLVNQLVTREDLAAEVASCEVPRRDWEVRPLYEASAWAWRILMAVVENRAGQADPGRYRAVPLESFRDDPLATALSLIDDVGLESTQQTVARVRALTEGAVVAPTTTAQHVLERDTKASVDAWRTRMSQADQSAIWRVCEPVAARYYQP